MENTKGCKIMSVWFGDRSYSIANTPATPEKLVEFLKISVEHEQRVDPGHDMDLIIVNNVGLSHFHNYWAPGDKEIDMSEWPNIGNTYKSADGFVKDGYPVGNEFLQSLDGMSIARGKIRVFHRYNSQGKGFDGWAYGYDKVREDYNYFLFQEDDHIFFMDDYYKLAVETFESAENVRYVGFSPFCESKWGQAHFAGGFGLSDRKCLDDVAQDDMAIKIFTGSPGSMKRARTSPRLPSDEVMWTYSHMIQEVTLLEKTGYPKRIIEGVAPSEYSDFYFASAQKLVPVKGVSPFCINWLAVDGHTFWHNRGWKNLWWGDHSRANSDTGEYYYAVGFVRPEDCGHRFTPLLKKTVDRVIGDSITQRQKKTK